MLSISVKEQVLSLPELISAIVQQLPIQDILVNAILVNHSWKSAVDSLPIQQALFFTPRPSDQGLEPKFNPLLVKKFPPWFKTAEPMRSGRRNREWEFKDLEWISSDDKCAAYKRKEASWRRMLPIQPPATIFEVRQAEHHQDGRCLKVGEVTMKGGVKMGTIYDWAQKTVRTPISKFQMEWHMVHPEEDTEIDFFMPSYDPEISEETEKRERAEGPSKVTMRTSYTMQCSVGMDPDLGPEFVSEGYEDLELIWAEEVDISCESNFEDYSIYPW